MRFAARTALLIMAVSLLTLPALSMEVIEDHMDMEGPFADGPAVTAACLECHEDVGEHFMKTSHWNWAPVQDVIGKGRIPLGKKNTLNNFCIGVSSNWARCTSCHAGYGWKDASFDFTNPENIDCLVCHDMTGTYKKFPSGAGHPVYEPKEWKGKIWEPVDLSSVARAVGLPNRNNCGSCHFNGGGGNAVKHGDMDKSLVKPTREVDVHMSEDGEGFSCQECHTTEEHNITGNALFATPGGGNHMECDSCHDDEELHEKRILNWHTKTLACQTCHIPVYAKIHATKMWWDWSTAGTKLAAKKDEFGKPTFLNKKGSFRWEKNVTPEYNWYNGVSTQYILGDKMNPKEVTRLNHPQGSKKDPMAKIYPFKVMRGKQIYDTKHNYFVLPKLFGKGGFWKTFDWAKASALGMQTVDLEFSGKFDFAETEAWWKLNHMVSPKEEALTCKNCHAKDGSGRMGWEALGYDSDPARKRGLSRYELKEAYDDLDLDQ